MGDSDGIIEAVVKNWRTAYPLASVQSIAAEVADNVASRYPIDWQAAYQRALGV